ncbi:MAG: glycosyltransferase family 4 protein [Prevotella sp.]|jgi:glycosyltransferase involved in cell wall biosynthesis|nr:glycosyltransferase family 4 protein [Prevotella sp.]
MRIGYDAKRIVRNATGLGSYGRTLINSLSEVNTTDDLWLYAPDAGRDDLRTQVEQRPNVSFHYPQHMPLRLQRDLWRMSGIVKDLKKDRIALYHGLSGELPQGIKAAGIPAIVTIHDLIFLRHPEYYRKIDVMIYRHKFYKTIREATRIIAISECTKRDILHYADFPEDRIDVIYQSCGTAFAAPVAPEVIAATRKKYALPDTYMLSVGSIEARKNLLLAVKALDHLPEHIHLVAIGRPTAYTQQVVVYAQQHGLAHRLHLLHGIPNAELPALYQGAKVFVYPSRYEGFGIPIIEAIQSGLPVVAATGSCLEEAGGPHSIYVDPDNEQTLAEAVTRYLHYPDYTRDAIACSKSYVARFENKDIAREMIEEYAKVKNEE